MATLVTPFKQRREALGLTQIDVALAADTSQPVISRIERGGVARLDLAYRLAAALDSTVEELFPDAVAASA